MAAAAAQVSAFLSFSAHDVPAGSPARAYAISRLPTSGFAWKLTTFATGSPLLTSRTSNGGKPASRTASVSIRCEQSTQEGGSLDVWLGRLAMVGFAVAISVEIATGKGLLEFVISPGKWRMRIGRSISPSFIFGESRPLLACSELGSVEDNALEQRRLEV